MKAPVCANAYHRHIKKDSCEIELPRLVRGITPRGFHGRFIRCFQRYTGHHYVFHECASIVGRYVLCCFFSASR